MRVRISYGTAHMCLDPKSYNRFKTRRAGRRAGTITKNVMRQEYGFAWAQDEQGEEGWHVLTQRDHAGHSRVRERAAGFGPAPPRLRASACAAPTLNATGPSRVTLSLR